MRKHSILPFFIPHQGCPHQCVFCNQRSITGYREPVPLEEIESMIESFTKEREDASLCKEIAYYGGSFTALPKERQKQLLRPATRAIREHKIERIRVSTRPDYINNNTVNFLKEYNVTLVELGIQSLDEEVLYRSGRGHGKSESLAAIDLLKKNGFQVGAQLMIGLPSDSYSKSIETTQEIIRKSPDYVRIYPTLVIKGTLLEKMYYSKQYLPLDLESSMTLCKHMAVLLRDAGITLIRIGLHPDFELQKSGLVCAGPFHPAYGELVKSALALDLLLLIMKRSAIREKGTLTIDVPSSALSIFIGHKKQNIHSLSSLFPKLMIKIIGSSFHNMIKINIIEHKRQLIARYAEGFKLRELHDND
ncbi:MAG: elongator complex protein 3 [bacterium]